MGIRDKSEWGTYEQIVGMLTQTDIVEVDRYDYKHFAMYWTNYKANNKALCFHVYKDDGSGKRCLQYLDEVVGKDLCRINNLKKEAHLRKLMERSKKDQINIAGKGLDYDDVINCPYDVVNNNCETHVTRWKYNCDGFSKQVDNFFLANDQRKSRILQCQQFI